MSTPLSDLRAMLAGQRSIPGQVLEIIGTKARIATKSGVIETEQVDLQPDDRVTIIDGRAVKTQDCTDVPVFHV